MDSTRTTKKPSRRPGERVFKTTKTCSIPNLTDLRRELGYGNPGEERHRAFKRAVRTQVQTFVSSSDNIPAQKLTKWKNPAHQRGLLEVTKDFLEVQGKGSEFWPPREVCGSTQPLQYCKDSAKIRNLMAKVFWRAAREDKRNKNAYSTTPLLSQSTDTSCQSEKSKDNSDDTKHPLPSSTNHLRGNSADDPIDIETMQSTASAAGPSRDNDPFMGISIEFAMHPPEDDLLENRTSSGPFSSSLFTPDVLGFQQPNTTGNHQTAPYARMQSNDMWDVPNDSPGATQAGQPTNKRPAEACSSDNNRQVKSPRQEATTSGQPAHPPNRAKKAAGKAKDVSASRRASARSKKQIVRKDVATNEDMLAIDSSSFLSNSLCDPRAKQGQRDKGKANDQVSQASSSCLRGSGAPSVSTGEQSSTQAAREAAARQASEQAAAAAAATAAGVEEQPPVVAGLSATAQGKQPDVPSRQATVAEAGPSRERAMIEESASRTETSAPRTEMSAAQTEISAAQTIVQLSTVGGSGGDDDHEQEQEQYSGIDLDEREQEALDCCELIYKSNIDNGVAWVTQRFSNSIFQMSLAEVFREVGLDDIATLHVAFVGRGYDIPERLQMGRSGEQGFTTFKEECLRHINNQHRRAASASMVQRRRVTYFLYFSNASFTI